MNPKPPNHDMPPPPAQRRIGLWVSLAIAAALALLLLPLMAFPLAAIIFLGVACARSAIVNRQVGWVGGFIFGVVLVIAGLAGIATVVALRLG